MGLELAKLDALSARWGMRSRGWYLWRSDEVVLGEGAGKGGVGFKSTPIGR
jgi:hypothetical protein